MTRLFKFSICLLSAFALGACQSISTKKTIDYKSTRTLPPLDVPPDMANLPVDESLSALEAIPGSAATYSGFVAGQRVATTGAGGPLLLPEYKDIRLERAGGQRWLVVKAEPEKVWPAAREFLLKNGLLIAREDPKTGVIETEWAENRAKVGDAIQRVLAKALSSLYSTGTRDKFRIRLERGTEAGTTEIYLSHNGMQEVVAEGGGTSPVQTLWQPRPSDPMMEAEMLRLLMAHIGLPGEVAGKILAGATLERATLGSNAQGYPSLNLQDSLERAWRRVGLSLDRIGLTVEDRDRSKGIYYVRSADSEQTKKKKGFFARLFGKKKEEPEDRQLQISLKSAKNGTDVEVLTEDGAPVSAGNSERILGLLYGQLK